MERLIADTYRKTLISLVSNFEFHTKMACREYPSVIKLGGGVVYLNDILRTSKDIALITESEFVLWQAICWFRNDLVHNNGVAIKDQYVKFPNGVVLKKKSGQMISGKFKDMPMIIDWCVNAYYCWSKSFLERVNHEG